MATNLALDDSLVEEAVEIGHHPSNALRPRRSLGCLRFASSP